MEYFEYNYNDFADYRLDYVNIDIDNYSYKRWDKSEYNTGKKFTCAKHEKASEQRP